MAERKSILIAGSGPGALEAALALSGSDQIDAQVTLISPQTEFLYRPNLVMEPFGVAQTARYSVGEIIASPDVQQWQGTIERVDPAAGKAWSPEGDEFVFDAMIVATGARPTETLSDPAITLGLPGSMDEVKRVVAEIDTGAIANVAFVRPDGPSYSLPAYEMALMAAERAQAQSGQQVSIGVVTPEVAPLESFGEENSLRVAEFCQQLGVIVRTSSSALAYDGRTLTLADGTELAVDRVVAIPALTPSVPDGIPTDPSGFVAVGPDQLVNGTSNIYAVGDITNFPFKQGGLASEEADAAAAAIEVAHGTRGERSDFSGEVRGILLTTSGRLIMRARVSAEGSESLPAEQTSEPLQKIDSRLLAQRLSELIPL